MGKLRSLGRLLLVASMPMPWIIVSCGGDSTNKDNAGAAGTKSDGGEDSGAAGGSKATGGTKASGGTKAAGGTTTAGASLGGEAAAGESSGGMSSGSGGEGGMPAVDLCEGVTCPYGQHCVAGSCTSACAAGKVMCSDSCIDPKVDNLFCGAKSTCDKGKGPNAQTAPLGEGGAGGDAPEPGVPNAGEQCAEGFNCQAGQCTYNGLKPGSDAIVKREGYSAQCKEWKDSLCTKPWIQIPLSAVKDVPNCADPIDTTSLRPVWFGGIDGEEEARTYCWIATGNSNVRYHDTEGAHAMECGWMYGSYDPEQLDCNDYRRYALVDSPGDIPDITWSFDILTGDGCRGGTYSDFECYWE